MKTGWCLFAFMSSLTCLGADVAVVQREATVHTLPSKGSKVVETLAARSKVTVLKRAGLWFQIQPIDSQAFKGWVRFSRLRMTGSTENAATQAESSGTISNLARSATGLFGYSSRQSQSRVHYTRTRSRIWRQPVAPRAGPLEPRVVRVRGRPGVIR
jgi:hypothetical protein